MFFHLANTDPQIFIGDPIYQDGSPDVPNQIFSFIWRRSSGIANICHNHHNRWWCTLLIVEQKLSFGPMWMIMLMMMITMTTVMILMVIVQMDHCSALLPSAGTGLMDNQKCGKLLLKQCGNCGYCHQPRRNERD